MSQEKQKGIAEGCAGTRGQKKRGESERKEEEWRRRGRERRGRRKKEEGESRK